MKSAANTSTLFRCTICLLLLLRCQAGPIFGTKLSLANKEMVMEHDIVLDEKFLLPFVTSILSQAGFVEQRAIPNRVQEEIEAGPMGNNVTETIYNFNQHDQTSKAVYKTIADCRRLHHSVKEIKPILSFLIHGGHRAAKQLTKKFSTKLPIKRCRAILTIYCLPSTDLNRRAPRSKRVRKFLLQRRSLS